MSSSKREHIAISDARANLTELVAVARLQGKTFILTQRGTPKAAIVPLELLAELTEGKPAPREQKTAKRPSGPAPVAGELARERARDQRDSDDPRSVIRNLPSMR
jgi:prevent-host-death family protein